jgi:exosome complex component RRP40
MEKTVGHTKYFYHPKVGDIVIGIVDRRNMDDWLVDIGYSHNAYLPGMAFDNVTKKSAPKFERGELVICYVEEVPEAGEVLLSCIGRTANEKLGRLAGGVLLRMRPKDIGVFEKIDFYNIVSKKTQLTVAVAVNGRLWFDTGNAVSGIQLLTLIKQAAEVDDPKAYFAEHIVDVNFE